MALSESSRNALLPAFLYASPATAGGVGGRAVAAPSAAGPAVWARAPSEPGRRIEMYSPAFYAACTAGGIASCGLTHMTVTPLDLVKCNMQVSVSGSFVLVVGGVCSLVILILFRFGSDVWGAASNPHCFSFARYKNNR